MQKLAIMKAVKKPFRRIWLFIIKYTYLVKTSRPMIKKHIILIKLWLVNNKYYNYCLLTNKLFGLSKLYKIDTCKDAHTLVKMLIHTLTFNFGNLILSKKCSGLVEVLLRNKQT